MNPITEDDLAPDGPDWEEAWSNFCAGTSLLDLADEHNLSCIDLMRRVRAEGWLEHRARFLAARSAA